MAKCCDVTSQWIYTSYASSFTLQLAFQHNRLHLSILITPHLGVHVWVGGWQYQLRAEGRRLVSNFMPSAISLAKHIILKFMNILYWKMDQKDMHIRTFGIPLCFRPTTHLARFDKIIITSHASTTNE